MGNQSYPNFVKECIIPEGKRERVVTMTDAEVYVSVVTLSIQDNTKLLQQLKLGLKHTINWNKYQSKVTTQVRNKHLDYLKENVKNFQKLKQHKYLIKFYIIQKSFCLKILFCVFLANFIFVVSHFKIHPAVHLNTSKALTSL